MDVNVKYLIITVVVIILAVGGYTVLNLDNSNTITITGSTSAYPVVEGLANAYMEKHPNVHITVSGGDSGVGITSVRSGKVDIGTSSRNLTNAESEGLTQYVIGNDAISIIVNDKNPVNTISLTQLEGIYTGNITNWNQVGGNNSSITPVTREVGSGTRADFENFILNNKSFESSIQVATFNYGLLQTVAVTPNSIGYIAHDYLNNQVKLLEVNDIPLTEQTVTNGSYPLTRQLLFIVKGTPTGNIKDFIDFSISPEGQSIVNNVEYNYTTSNVVYNPTSGIGPSGG
ncbi:phosphate ABC transporter substrate-binding protein [Methanobacterium sp.]|uniref:phosphate ABC transporter substrate-binding protein n=1 Tax=Methanobacterium sp. TaxID=2164 RepID=UPI003C7371F6